MDVYPQPVELGRFWALVAESGGDAERLKRPLLRLSREDILAVDLRLYESLQALNRRDIHDMTDGSDDGFLYVRRTTVFSTCAGRRFSLRAPVDRLARQGVFRVCAARSSKRPALCAPRGE